MHSNAISISSSRTSLIGELRHSAMNDATCALVSPRASSAARHTADEMTPSPSVSAVSKSRRTSASQ